MQASKRKELFERVVAMAGLAALSPLLAAAAFAILIDSGFPVFFRHQRVGRGGRKFWLLKFRSMVANSSGPAITSSNDARITRVGAVLRRFKIDELPQLWNVVKGDMTLVGPRPEVPQYVDMSSPVWANLLTVKPGVTDLASLTFRHEEAVLAGVTEPDRYYREVLLPAKLAISTKYLQVSSFWVDMKLIAVTLWYSAFPNRFDSNRIRQLFSANASPARD